MQVGFSSFFSRTHIKHFLFGEARREGTKTYRAKWKTKLPEQKPGLLKVKTKAMLRYENRKAKGAAGL